MDLPFLFFGVAACLIVAFFVFIFIAASKAAVERAENRSRELGELAGEIGLTFDPSFDETMSEQFKHFGQFCEGDNRTAYNTLTGSLTIDGQEFPTRIGDYTYTVTRSKGGKSGGTTTTTYRLTYLILKLPFIDVPDTIIRHENIFDKIGAALGFDDIDFESSEFSRKFFVKGKNRQFTYGLIHQGMMEHFLTGPFTPIEIESGDCLICEDDITWSVPEIREKIAFAKGFIQRWPRDLLDDVYNRT